MPIFRYKARNKKGKIKTGIDIGLNETDIVSRFRRKELEVISLSPAEGDIETKLDYLLKDQVLKI